MPLKKRREKTMKIKRIIFYLEGLLSVMWGRR